MHWRACVVGMALGAIPVEGQVPQATPAASHGSHAFVTTVGLREDARHRATAVAIPSRPPSPELASPRTPLVPPAAAALPAADFEFTGSWAEGLTPRQRSLVTSFADSLPRYHADPFDDGFLARAGAVVFPEMSTVKIGKVTVAGGLITAFKKRNPFGLLNPLILGFGW